MKWHFEDIKRNHKDTKTRRNTKQNEKNFVSWCFGGKEKGFTLVESMAATVLLAFISVSVWLVMERCMNSAADTTQRMRAFEAARENMEKLISADSVQASTEYGASEQFPDIRWQTTVESFYEPLNSRMWIRAVCTAEYTDSAGETQTVELTHWLTDLTNAQLQQMMQRNELLRQVLAKHIIETEELAAQYAGVNVETIRQWVKNGMPTADGAYLKPWLDTYLRTDGNPTAEDKQDTLTRYPELSAAAQSKSAPSVPGVSPGSGTPGDGTKLPDDLDPELKRQMETLFKE
jgi:type II secretory pathway component PulJ